MDHMTQSQVNASTVVQEKMRHQSLDEFYELMRIMVEATEVNPPKASAQIFSCRLLRCILQEELSMYKGDIGSNPSSVST